MRYPGPLKIDATTTICVFVFLLGETRKIPPHEASRPNTRGIPKYFPITKHALPATLTTLVRLSVAQGSYV
jgi:hypothetical protein